MPTLFGAPLSPFVRKVAIFLEEKGVSYEWKPVRPHDRDKEFAGLSPLGKIPAYKDDKAALADSSVICFYLEKTHPSPPLYPADILPLTRALWFEEYFDGGMIKPMTTIYDELLMNPEFAGKPTDPAALKDGEEKFGTMCAYLESQLKPGEWMVENRFGIADIALGTGFISMRMAKHPLDAQKFPLLAAYIERVLARPSFMKCANYANAFLDKARERLKQKNIKPQ